jgi:predicted neuraminidase
LTRPNPSQPVDERFLALQPPTINTAPGPEYADDTRLWQGIPGIERTHGGRLYAAWYSGGDTEGPDNYVALAKSDDNGASWSAPVVVVAPDGPIRAYDEALWTDPLGRVWLFWAQAHTFYDGRAGVWATVTANPDDDTPTWSPARRLADGIMLNKPIVLSTGEWLMCPSVWINHGNVAFDPAPADLAAHTGTHVTVSTDSGDTWELRGTANVPKEISTFDEHMVIERRDGSLWMLIRVEGGIAESTSSDGGRTWSPVHMSGIHSAVSRFFLGRLSTGELLLVKHTQPDGSLNRSHLAAHLSTDDGATWSDGLLLDEREGVSYPDAVEAPDGTICVIYDYNRYSDRLILMATFTRDDVAAGTGVSPAFRTAVKVNQATRPRPEAD